ncbi:MAG: HAMP domain-containing histidine kinase [Sulfurospirillum cavolei]|nr:HAMP domain-containing histidine kinase [Sulfurospirillum cavolei]
MTFEAQERLEIKGCPSQFAQVVLNIIGNAKDILLERAIDDPHISITLQRIDGRICIRIVDNGGGIEMEPIERIFEPYVSTKHAKSGTGIGLYMSKTIIEQHAQGSLKAFNTDQGACFEIIL